MSGFIAIYNTNKEPVDRSLLKRLTNSLKFRGPDQQKVWTDGEIGMGHALFKTTFEAKYENQPATLDNKVWITCSARIDDREHLVNKLGMKREINLQTTPDSELILHAYNKWGEDCLDHLLGDFAFVIWDTQQQKLFCARDRLGMRKLYYAQQSENIVLCNTLGTLLQHPKIQQKLNERAIGGILLFGKYTWMDKSITMFEDISALLPAHKLVFQNGRMYINQYWDIPDNIPLLHYKDPQNYTEHFLEILNTSILDRIRMPSVAILMSGGMDSTSIAAITKQLQRQKKITDTQINAITVVYDRIIPSKERYFADLAAQHLDIPIHYIYGDHYPFLDPSIKTTYPMELPQPKLWEDTQKKINSFSRVVLVGDAADELIEYPSTLLAVKESNIFNSIRNMLKLQYLYGKHPPLGLGIRTKLKAWISNNAKHSVSNYPYPVWINKEFEQKMHLKLEWEKMWHSLRENQSMHSRKATLQASLTNADWGTDDLLMHNDYTLPEARDPFLDLRMIEFILALPTLPWLFNKHILRASMKNMLPDQLRKRAKTPLGHLHHALTQQDENRWIETWKPSISSSPYIKDTFSFSQSDIPSQHYLKSRAILLDMWLTKPLWTESP